MSHDGVTVRLGIYIKDHVVGNLTKLTNNVLREGVFQRNQK